MMDNITKTKMNNIKERLANKKIAAKNCAEQIVERKEFKLVLVENSGSQVKKEIKPAVRTIEEIRTDHFNRVLRRQKIRLAGRAGTQLGRKNKPSLRDKVLGSKKKVA